MKKRKRKKFSEREVLNRLHRIKMKTNPHYKEAFNKLVADGLVKLPTIKSKKLL